MDSLKAFLAIVIIRVDDDKRSLDDLLRCKHSLTGSPRLCPAFWQSSRDIIDILESIVNSYIMRRANGGNAIADNLFEFLLNTPAQNFDGFWLRLDFQRNIYSQQESLQRAFCTEP